jgi:hypothetical protein
VRVLRLMRTRKLEGGVRLSFGRGMDYSFNTHSYSALSIPVPVTCNLFPCKFR